MDCARGVFAAWLAMAVLQDVSGASVERVTVPSRAAPDGRPALVQAGRVLADLPMPQPAERVTERAAGGRVRVERIVFRGSSVFTAADFAPLHSQYEGKTLSFDELLMLRDAATLMYVERGFLTSGAVLTALDDGELTVELVEGRLAAFDVQPSGRLRAGFVEALLRGYGDRVDPVNVFALENRLQLLQQDRHIDRVDAELLPTLRRGESVLRVRPVPTHPWALSLEASNYSSPSVGADQLYARLDVLNVSGRTDDVYAGLRVGEGLTALSFEYDFPVGARGTRVAVYAFGADSKIVAAPFGHLDIEAQSRTYGVRLAHPLRRTVVRRDELYLTGEIRRSSTYLLGSPFSFVAGAQDGRAKLTAVRAGWRRTHARGASVLATRVELSRGVDLFDATNAPRGASSAVPDGGFTAILGQAQWVRRLPWREGQLAARLALQFADRPLLAVEQLQIGGRYSVRGYRENTLIRDNGIVASIDWRVQLLRNLPGAVLLEAGPFIDASYSFDDDRAELGPNYLASAGIGLRWIPIKRLEVEAHWGYGFDDIDYPGFDELQDRGFHLRANWGPDDESMLFDGRRAGHCAAVGGRGGWRPWRPDGRYSRWHSRARDRVTTGGQYLGRRRNRRDHGRPAGQWGQSFPQFHRTDGGQR